jgi:heat shock protein HtpX
MFQAVGKNRTKTAFIVSIIFLFFAAVVWSITFFLFELGIMIGIIAVVIAFIGTFITYWNSDKIVLRLHKARPATPAEDAQLVNILEGLCIAAGVPKPRLYVMEDPALNAFATGRNPKNAVICVTTGLMKELDYYQLEGVVAHELAHIKNYDILLQTVAGIMIGAALVVARSASRAMFMSRGGGGRGGGSAQLIMMAIGLVFLIIAPIVGQMLKMLLSRNREFLADAKGAEFTRNPEALASALEKIGGSNITLERASNATEGLYIVTPCADMRAEMRSKKKKSSVFSTHPPIDRRVEALRNLR